MTRVKVELPDIPANEAVARILLALGVPELVFGWNTETNRLTYIRAEVETAKKIEAQFNGNR